ARWPPYGADRVPRQRGAASRQTQHLASPVLGGTFSGVSPIRACAAGLHWAKKRGFLAGNLRGRGIPLVAASFWLEIISLRVRDSAASKAMALNRRPDDWTEVPASADEAYWIDKHRELDLAQFGRRNRLHSPTLLPLSARLPDAAIAFQDTTRALKIRKYWLHLILTGEKVVEVRGSKCAHLGRVTLMETGSLLLRARVTITASHRMTDAEIQEHHEAVSALNYSEYWAWSLADVEVLQPPIAVPSIVARGSVTWMRRERWEAWDAGQLAAPQTLPQYFHRSGRSRSPPAATEEVENID
ncbi:hypothetical protein AK812_SmicGene44047, partial [Symbiodinium microadriaticum]